MMRTLVVAANIAALSCGVARASECKGVSFPDQMQAGGAQVTLLKVGASRATLNGTPKWGDGSANLSNAASELIRQIVREVRASESTKGWQGGLERTRQAGVPALKGRIAAVDGVMTAVQSR